MRSRVVGLSATVTSISVAPAVNRSTATSLRPASDGAGMEDVASPVSPPVVAIAMLVDGAADDSSVGSASELQAPAITATKTASRAEEAGARLKALVLIGGWPLGDVRLSCRI